MRITHTGFASIIVLAACIIFVKPSDSKHSNSTINSSPKVESGFMDVDGGKIYYETAGDGEVIVLVHDGSLHHVTWDEQFYTFAENHKVIRYDRRGYGKSSYPEKSFSNIEDLKAVFDFLDVKKAAHLVPLEKPEEFNRIVQDFLK